MPAKSKAVFVCSECGYEAPKWTGRCPACGEWNTMNEEIKAPPRASQAAGVPSLRRAPQRITELNPEGEQRYKTGLKELDRVLGGGIVKGGLMLIGGDPGIGKSTLLLQICATLGQAHTILYVSGEESERQIKLRADRLDVASDNLYVLCETDVQAILEAMYSQKPDILIVDSIQTMSLAEIASSPGSVTQVRECYAGSQKRGYAGIHCGPCQQGWEHRRPQSDGAYRGLRAVFRRGPAHQLPHAALCEKPLRRHQ